ncbi:hypothetical protein M7775_03875 [Sporomusa sphaeroides DSM 2875]|jgi:hypothetical protein|uniref:WapI family immunity protein n=1 Tax=Sporomusa sphaeroides TaxID=47679 RepID=UPI00202E267F|nr:hypothetical protein [Sporomusa sphaeroides]MCM0757708.1 hypothetical protein [Sporomusa sphaeroides DSM 2875]
MDRISTNSIIVDHLYAVENYHTFKVTVNSGAFSGTSNFCLSKENIGIAFEQLGNMYETLKGICKITDYDSDAHITIEMENLGHMNVYGQIGGSYEEHSLKFRFITDQTVLCEIIKLFKEIL